MRLAYGIYLSWLNHYLFFFLCWHELLRRNIYSN